MPAPEPAPWPPGATARYLTLAGDHVTITPYPDEAATRAECGCGHALTTPWPPAGGIVPPQSHADQIARAWAQDHAETCRSMPHPDTPRQNRRLHP